MNKHEVNSLVLVPCLAKEGEKMGILQSRIYSLKLKLLYFVLLIYQGFCRVVFFEANVLLKCYILLVVLKCRLVSRCLQFDLKVPL